MSNVTILVGAQWGDEGKGKWIDILAHDAQVVARYQGGNNAGHTLYVDGQKVVLHQIPSGIFQPGHTCALSAGVVVNPAELVAEMALVAPMTSLTPDNLWLSARAHVITPWHVYCDARKEQEAATPIGTTKKGIGPTYSDKASRVGLRLGDYCQPSKRQAWLEERLAATPGFQACYEELQDQWQAFFEAAAQLQPFVCDAESRLRQAMKVGKKVLMEGAQGALLDLNHGTYPFVTSSGTASGGAMASLGFAPRHVGAILGVAKAYATRVGEGPFPSELHDEDGAFLAKQGNEFGATTGRPRRCGWLDAVALRYSQDVNGFDGLILNKMDVLSGLKELKICVRYRHPELGVLEEFPWDAEVLKACVPEYVSMPGWSEAIPASGRFEDLPAAAQEYVKAVEKYAGVHVRYVGTGVGRGDYLER